jgi:ketosteroid isomerase-like protein
MSQENVNRFIEALEAFNRMGETAEAAPAVIVTPAANLEALRGFLGIMDPEIQFEPQQAALEGGYVGHEGVIRWLADLAEHYAGGHMDLPDIRDLDDRVLALGTLRVIGRGSGIEAEVPVAFVARFRNGFMTECKDYGDKSRAIEAAGLSE